MVKDALVQLLEVLHDPLALILTEASVKLLIEAARVVGLLFKGAGPVLRLSEVLELLLHQQEAVLEVGDQVLLPQEREHVLRIGVVLVVLVILEHDFIALLDALGLVQEPLLEHQAVDAAGL